MEQESGIISASDQVQWRQKVAKSVRSSWRLVAAVIDVKTPAVNQQDDVSLAKEKVEELSGMPQRNEQKNKCNEQKKMLCSNLLELSKDGSDSSLQSYCGSSAKEEAGQTYTAKEQTSSSTIYQISEQEPEIQEQSTDARCGMIYNTAEGHSLCVGTREPENSHEYTTIRNEAGDILSSNSSRNIFISEKGEETNEIDPMLSVTSVTRQESKTNSTYQSPSSIVPNAKSKVFLTSRHAKFATIAAVATDISTLSRSGSCPASLYATAFKAQLMGFQKRYAYDMHEMHKSLDSIDTRLQELQRLKSINQQLEELNIKENTVNIPDPINNEQAPDRSTGVLKRKHRQPQPGKIVCCNEANSFPSPLRASKQEISSSKGSAEHNMSGIRKKVINRGVNVLLKEKVRSRRSSFHQEDELSDTSSEALLKEKQERHVHVTQENKCIHKLGRSWCCWYIHQGCLSALSLSSRQQFVSVGLFQETVRVLQALLHDFCTKLIEARQKMLHKLGITINTRSTAMSLMMHEFLPDARFAQIEHLKYGIQAFINRTMFEDFETEYFGILTHRDRQLRKLCLLSFQCLMSISPADAIDVKSPGYNRCFHLFCSKKLQLFQEKLDWFEKWPDNVTESFLDVSKYMWIIHNMASAFRSHVYLFYVNEWAEFDPDYMEAVVEGSLEELDQPRKYVEFMVNPGFELCQRIIKSLVYIKPAARHRLSDLPSTRLQAPPDHGKQSFWFT
ncbi:hypothetical protein O6H91_08G112200 [Diphasiastrum complanatum]|uniref:Uncharacterized protein n=1 Tax=Diphasiastrum complanatum TaxID=34168 RepID=A0ACC2D209_DIPCM|nr:hypothetical protein O6H91_08G112200 [Diphasiastrum complanatum]